MKKLFLLFLLIFICSVCIIASGDTGINDVVIHNNYGSINWTKKYYESSGIAYLDPKISNVASNNLITWEKAEDEGFKNIFNLIVYQYYDSQHNVLDLIKSMPDIQILINNYIHESKKSNLISKDDKRQVNFTLNFLSDTLSIYDTLNLARDYYIPIKYNSPYIHHTKFTGLVIDARGLKLNPALKPKVLNQNREVVYYFDNVKWEFIKEHGFITYINSSADIEQYRDIIGDNPFFVAALDSFGINNTDVILADESLNWLLGNKENFNILYESHVIIIIDKI